VNDLRNSKGRSVGKHEQFIFKRLIHTDGSR